MPNIEQQNKFSSAEMLERIAYAPGIDSPELFYKGPFPLEEIKLFQEGVKTDFEKRMERLMKSNEHTPAETRNEKKRSKSKRNPHRDAMARRNEKRR
ncbi:MAG: hypothetical protein LBB81_00180 [Treponema sp.]|nr:hypothetical protein [Treponema sp.]